MGSANHQGDIQHQMINKLFSIIIISHFLKFCYKFKLVVLFVFSKQLFNPFKIPKCYDYIFFFQII
jgi:hypothetical protein